MSLALALSLFMYCMASVNLYAGGRHSCPRVYPEDHRAHPAARTSSALWDYRESMGSSFLYKKTTPLTVGDEMPIAHSQTSAPSGAPVSIVYNAWPEKVRNESLFSYLIPDEGSADTYPEFCEFVQTAYKSSCAIVYYPSGEDFSVILGSGGLVKNYNTIATARHVIEGLNLDFLCVRFYNYLVNSTEDPQSFLIQEGYLDVKLTEIRYAHGGLDACLIKTCKVSEEFKKKYMRPINIATSPLRGAHIIPEGHYALFHFAGGRHLVSVGNVGWPGPGMSWIHSNIEIEAGPGASGSIPIQRYLGVIVAHGVSIHREEKAEDGAVSLLRRIIPFSYFDLGFKDFDRITTPYAPGAAPLDSGYEFLSWTLSKYEFTDRETKPGGDHYKCLEGHACHHIIPIRDLMYLWDYFDDTKNTYQQKDWARFRTLLGELCPYDVTVHNKLPEDPTQWTQNMLLTRKFFAWSWWNLFRGPKDRKDDPRWSGVQNEKERPEYFPKELWDSVQSIFWRIQRLKELDHSPFSKEIMKTAVTKAEDNIFEALKAVKCHWKKAFLSQKPYVIVPQHRADEWKQDSKTKQWYVKSVSF